MTRHEATHRDVVCLADVKPDPLRWLWQGRIPIGKLTLLDGNPGDGKTTITADIAARLSNGAEMPDGTRAIDAPAATLFMSAEDGLGDTLRPRLVASGARLDLIHALPHVTGRDGTRKLPRLPDDVDRIADAIRHKDVKLIVIDPLMAFFSAQTDSHRDQHARAALQPLAHLAEEFGAAIMLVRHPTKSSKNRTPIHSGGGSIGIIGAARAAFIVGRDPDDSARRVLAATKLNLATLPLSLSYSIEPAEGAGRIVWHGPSQHDAQAILAAPTDGDRSAMALARAFLQGLMVSAGGCIAAKEAKARGEAEGIAERTLERARLALGYASERSGFGPGGGNLWRSPVDHHREQVQVPSGAPPMLASAVTGDRGEHGDDGEHGQQRSAVASVPMLAEGDDGDHCDDGDRGDNGDNGGHASAGEHGHHGEHGSDGGAPNTALMLANGDAGEDGRVVERVVEPASAPDSAFVWRTGPSGSAIRFRHDSDEVWVAPSDLLKALGSNGTVIDRGLPSLRLPNGRDPKLKVVPARALAQRLRERPALIAKLQGREREQWCAFLGSAGGAA